MKKRISRLFLLFLLLIPINSTVGAALPEDGIRAETAGEWKEAIEIYRSKLSEEPGRVDIWLRLADIEWRMGNASAAAEALKSAIQFTPQEPGLYFRLSQAYSVAGDPQRAFDAIEKAVALDPKNKEYLEARASIANWLGRYDISSDSYKRIYQLSPDSDDTILNLARSQMWGGMLDESVRNYKRYYGKRPGHKDALLEYANAEGWRGNFAASLDLLGKYRNDFGKTFEYQKVKARILAQAERPTAAMSLIEGLLKTAPEDYDLNYSRTVALHYADRHREAEESLPILIRLRPQSKETYDVQRLVKTDIRSNIEARFRFYADSDDLRIYTSGMKGALFLTPETNLQAGVIYDYLHVKEGSGLENIDGTGSAEHSRAWMGIGHRFSPGLMFEGSIGASVAEGRSKFPTYKLTLNIKPSDEFRLRFERDYGYFVVSPRTVSLRILEGSNSFQVAWSPHLNYTVDASFNYNTLSDDNRFRKIIFAPRRSVSRTEKLNLDLGLNALWLSFDKNLDNGYYNPELYQRYLVTCFAYWKINDDNGVSLIASIGIQKDNNMSKFKPGYNLDVEGTFGIYRDWMLKVTGGIFHNVRQTAGAFDAYSIGVSLTRRF